MLKHTSIVAAKISASVKAIYANRSFDQLGRRAKRQYIIEDQDGECLWCGISEWRDQPINFEMDHIDGNRKNFSRENLRILCPNCHSQTPTHRFVGRHHTNKTKLLLANKQRDVAQLEERQTLNLKVVGSSPTIPTIGA